MSQEPEASLVFLTAEDAEGYRGGSCVVIVRTREEFVRWLRDRPKSVEWLQVEDLLEDQEVWAIAAQGTSKVPLDVILTDPTTQFSSLYRLVDVRIVRGVRVTIPAMPGFMKALRLAASLQLPVRLLPGQPSTEALAELTEAAHFYLHDPMVETPVEFFHSLLAVFAAWETARSGDFSSRSSRLLASRCCGPRIPPSRLGRNPSRPSARRRGRVRHVSLAAVCAGYFKSPNPTYDCAV
jgi:hypothetical protein